MKKKFLKTLPILLVLIFPLWYFLSWDIPFDAADGSWLYSLYHFLDYRRQLAFALFTLLVVVLLIVFMDTLSDKARTIAGWSATFLTVFLFFHLASMFFSLHSLARGGVYNWSNSAYQPLVSTLSLYLQFPAYIGSIMLYGLSLYYSEKDE